jgi:hypothetical protein
VLLREVDADVTPSIGPTATRVDLIGVAEARARSWCLTPLAQRPTPELGEACAFRA